MFVDLTVRDQRRVMPALTMRRPLITLVMMAGAAAVLTGCAGSVGGPQFTYKDEPWRAQDEQACLASTAYAQRPTIDFSRRSALGKSHRVCGAIRPFQVSALTADQIELTPPATLRCPMIPATERWLRDVVQPAARQHFGMPIRKLHVAASYACRPMNHRRGARISEHGYANALDVSAVTLADGRRFALLSGWNGKRDERGFWRSVHAGSCGIFSTVLGPEHDRAHHDHFHFDLMQRRSGKPFCR